MPADHSWTHKWARGRIAFFLKHATADAYEQAALDELNKHFIVRVFDRKAELNTDHVDFVSAVYSSAIPGRYRATIEYLTPCIDQKSVRRDDSGRSFTWVDNGQQRRVAFDMPASEAEQWTTRPPFSPLSRAMRPPLPPFLANRSG